MAKVYDVIVIGGGQSALAVAYYLRRTTLEYIILDKEALPGGAWQHTWDSLTLFSPALWSSLPGVIMPGGNNYYPTRDEAITYLRNYEERYQFPVVRPVAVTAVSRQENVFTITTDKGDYKARTVVSATGSYANPYMPIIPGRETFKGTVIHSSQYKNPEAFTGKKVAIIGEGNSGAQILAEVSKVAETLWIVKQTPSFLPDEVDGRYLFDVATMVYKAKQEGRHFQAPTLGHIVKVPAVKEGIERDIYHSLPAFDYFTENGIGWDSGQATAIDAVIFCTGFSPALQHLTPLNAFRPDGRIHTHDTISVDIPGLWLVGYGQWTGFASATLIGVGRTAKRTAEEIMLYLQ